MTIKNALAKGKSMLIKSSPTPLLDSEILLGYLLKKPKEYLYAYTKQSLSRNISNQYFKLIKNRGNHVPIAYLVKHQEFFGNHFYINKNVLIPSPDSEVLVQESLETWENLEKKYPPGEVIRIWDIGTGSGCLIISLLLAKWTAKKTENQDRKGLSKTRMLASDISEKALTVAKFNAKKLLSEKLFKLITIKKHNIFSDKPPTKSKFQIILSNPPYLPDQLIPKLQKEVGFYEPRIALDGHSDGLAFYLRIKEVIIRDLHPKGFALLELNSELAEDIANIFEAFDSEIFYDLENRPRAIKIALNYS